ncbi:MAG: cytosine permease [Saprospiraceae bacterium]
MSENNQYTTSKVEAKDFTSGWMIALVIAGLGFSLPILYLGSEIALGIGLTDALIAYGISTAVLTILCCLTTLVGNRSRLSTYMILRFPFGKEGAKIINFIIGLSLLGWFSVALELLAQAIQETTIEVIGIHFPLWSIVVFASIFITITTIYGIRSLEKLSNIAVPILSVFLCYAVYKAFGQTTAVNNLWEYQPAEGTMTLFDATSVLIGSSILVPILMADFSRFIYNDRQSLISVLGIVIGTPLVLVISAVIAIKTGEVDIIQIMKSLDLVIPAFVLLFVSTWVTNASNLYSTVLTFSTIQTTWRFRTMCLVTSVLGTILALFEFSDYLFDFLNILGVFTPSICTIYLLDFFWLRKQQYDLEEMQAWGIPALISWGISSVIALFTYTEVFSLTGAYFVDSFLVAGLCYFFLSKR